MKKLITLLLLTATTAITAGNVQPGMQKGATALTPAEQADLLKLRTGINTYFSGLKTQLPKDITEQLQQIHRKYFVHETITKLNLEFAYRAYLKGVEDAIQHIGYYLYEGTNAMQKVIEQLELKLKMPLDQIPSMNTQQTPPATTNQTQMVNATATQR